VVDIGDGARMAVVVIVVGGCCGCGAVQVVIRSPLTLKFCESSTLAAEKTFHQATNKQYCIHFFFFFPATRSESFSTSLLRFYQVPRKSYNSFSDNEHLIGDAAKNQVAMNAHNMYDSIIPFSVFNFSPSI
jgi:hypothetical protein